jgi:hypothetical protein
MPKDFLSVAHDTDTLNLSQTARALGVHRNTVGGWIRAGYQPEFGRFTTPGHLKRWLREVYAPRLRERKEKERREALARLAQIKGRGKASK